MSDQDYGSTSYEYDPRPQAVEGETQHDYSSAPPSPKKKSMGPVAIIVIVAVAIVGGLILLSVVAAGVMYIWVISLADTGTSVTVMKFSIQDGDNDPGHPDDVGCFFLIRAEKGVDINPKKYSFWVSEEGFSPKKLNFEFRDYDWGIEPRVEGGDRNATYRYDNRVEEGRYEDMPVEADSERWTDGEYIGFDMPSDSMGIDIVSGNKYEVMIKDPNNEIIYWDVFIYKFPYL